MKKLMTLLLAAGLVFSAANNASAVEVKASGFYQFAFSVTDNMATFQKDGADKHFTAIQRLRIGLDFVVSENLSATYQIQVGPFLWGGSNASELGENSGGQLGKRAQNISTRLAYLDWIVPNTDVKVRMGQQVVAMPSYVFGSPVLDDTATGILVSAPITPMIDITAGWVRAETDNQSFKSTWAEYNNNGDPVPALGYTDEDIDVFTVIADVKGEGFAVSPWVLLGPAGKNSRFGDGQNDSFLWFAGIGTEVTMFDPFRIAFDFYYSALDTDNSAVEQSGWYAAASFEMDTAWGTPGLKGWYASGDDDDANNGHERPLTLSGGFNATNSYFDGSQGVGYTVVPDNADVSGGNWGIGFYWNGLSFVENLTHDFAVVYVQGTNDEHAPGLNVMDGTLSTKDSLVEIDFTSTYQIYENLATSLELGYIITDFDEDVHNQKYDDAFRATVNFIYTF